LEENDMPKIIRVASIQMDAAPAPLDERLARAENFIAQAAQAGAQLVVLPELFNSGYAYTDENFGLAEPIDGTTSAWIKSIAARFNIHLAGTFMLLEQGEIYNSMLLFSPSGQMWRYDKNYPWAWERGYFRGRRGMTVAQTELGDLGMLICWDIGHVNLWKQYAGKVDMIVIASCPPDGPAASYIFPKEEKLEFTDVNAFNSMKDVGTQFFGEMVNQQAQWLGVPAVNSGVSGTVQTHIPKAKVLLRTLSFMAPQLGKVVSKAEQMQMSAPMIPSCKVVDANGNVLAKRPPTEGEGFVLAEVTLADSKRVPTQPQPKPPMDWMVAQMAIFNADIVIPAMMRSVYKNGLKQIKK
jgi:carbon-nitrogen hydrolase